MNTAEAETPRRRRLFLALYPTSAERRRLLDSVALQAPDLLAERARPIPLENLHMTLVFLGGVGPEVQDCIEAVASTIDHPSVTVTLDRLGYWPRKRMLWAIPDPAAIPAALPGLVAALHDGLADCDVPLEQRDYRPHVTLARRLARPPRVSRFPAVEWRFSQFALMESVPTPDGVRYPALRTWPLRESA
jgi:2'-5' RNA ligase